MQHPLFLLLLAPVAFAIDISEAAAQYQAAAANSTLSQWAHLNATLGGKLAAGTPISAPCFPVVNGKNVTVDSTACAVVQQNYTKPSFRSGFFGAYMLPQWETCQSKGQQCLLDATNTSDPHAWTDYSCQQGSIPPYYIDVRNASDVQTAYAFSLASGVHLSIKNSGHDYKGRSSGADTLSLWTHNLQSIAHNPSFVPAGCAKSVSYNAVTLGSGAYWQQVYDFAELNNITVIGGYHQTIASGGGWVQGGGHSILSPNYGLGIDRVVEFKVVTPDGQYRTANECQNEDLFWALRGGGGSTYGVVLETSQRVEPQLTLQVASISFTQNATNPLPFLKLVTNNALKWGKEGWGGHIGANNLITVNPKLTLAEAQASMQPIVDYVTSLNGSVVIETVPSWNTFFNKYVPSAESAVGVASSLGTRLIPTANFETEAGLEKVYEMLTGFLPHANPYIVVGTPFLYNYKEGTTSATPAWRNSLWHLGLHEDFPVQRHWTPVKKATYESISSLNEGEVYEKDHISQILTREKKTIAVGSKGASAARYFRVICRSKSLSLTM
ncbi:FAD-binding domain-containing protein [Athelia psychrophila]|uniref:FAD-binding domain-containing protein n=1 Tax=Athelia psychrophila TaxID=1759441 RepID=A0A166S2D7_9AGAM|nr:FAD-binding domain-containing protein [Fibularhizoctonia sp. CBS 109695]